MMNADRNILLLIIILLLIPISFAAHIASSDASIGGKYFCKGYDVVEKSKYSNFITVDKTGDTYSFKWIDSKGYPTAYGTGVMNANVKNVMAVVYENLNNHDNKGIIFYKINPDGSFTGRWAVKKDNLIGTDNCSKR